MPANLVGVQQANQSRAYEKRVFFSGSGVVLQGIGLCYDRLVSSNLSPDIKATTATNYNEVRDNVVALPSSSNRGNFAGVSANYYPAVTGGQWITIYEPGSVCPVAVDDATTINQTVFNFAVTADPGVFVARGLRGRGAMLALQTTLTASATSGNGPIAKSIDGTATYTQSTKTIAKTSLGSNVVAGDLAVIVGGAVAADGTKPLTLGVFTVASATANAVVLTTDPAATNGAATATCCVYIIRGSAQARPLVLAYLYDGQESGGVDWYSGPAADATALDTIGYTYFTMGGITIASDAVPTLAVPVINAEANQRGFECLGTITTSTVKVTPTTSTAIQRNGTSTLATLASSAANQQAILEWSGVKWSVQHLVGMTQA